MHSTVEVHDCGLLQVGAGHEVYWEVSGNPTGVNALYLHGGPGSTLGEGYRRRFDPERYRIIAVQQRGAGRSLPSAAERGYPLAQDSTGALVADLEAVREHLGVDRWLVTGASWGSTLALHYAVTHPERVSGLVLVAVTATSPEEVHWITEGVGRLYPEAWEELASFVEAHTCWRRGRGRLVDAVAEVMAGDDQALRTEMAISWMSWEASHIQIGLPVEQLAPVRLCEWPIADQIAFTTLVSHHWSHHAALDEGFVPAGGILENLARLREIPVCMVHGRRDVSGPVSTPWQIKAAVPQAALHVVESEGHGGPRMAALWSLATQSFADTGSFDAMVVGA